MMTEAELIIAVQIARACPHVEPSVIAASIACFLLAPRPLTGDELFVAVFEDVQI